MRPNQIDVTGQRFGILVVVRFDESTKLWVCRCDCGGSRHTTAGLLRAKLHRSCGCARGRPRVSGGAAANERGVRMLEASEGPSIIVARSPHGTIVVWARSIGGAMWMSGGGVDAVEYPAAKWARLMAEELQPIAPPGYAIEVRPAEEAWS